MTRKRTAIRHQNSIVQDLFEAIEKSGMSDREIGEKTGLHASDLSRWRTGDRTPSLERVHLVMAAIGLPERISAAQAEASRLRAVVEERLTSIAPTYAPRSGLSRAERVTATFFGDPPSGRSALDQRGQA